MAPVERKLLVLTMIGYMKSGLNEDELCENQVNKHSRLVCDLMAKYGVTRYEITHNTKKTRAELSKLFDPRFVEFSDHDFIVRIIFPDVETFLKLKADPFYIERVSQDHLNFADQKMKTKMTLGYLHEIINEGEVIPLADQNANQCTINNEIFVDGSFQQKK